MSCFFTTLISAHKNLDLDHIISGKNKEFATELTAPWKLGYKIKCGIYIFTLFSLDFHVVFTFCSMLTPRKFDVSYLPDQENGVMSSHLP